MQLHLLYEDAFLEGVRARLAFRLEAGEDALGDYQFGTKMVHHRFCKRCGVAPFGAGDLEAMDGAFVRRQPGLSG